MKKLFLLLAASSMAMSAGAQERSASVVFNGSTTAKQDIRPATHPIMAHNHSGAKTTAVTAAWYDYGTEILASNVAIAGTSFSTMFFWPDTTAIFGTGSTTTPYLGYNYPSAGYSYNVSTGLGFNPLGNDWASVSKQISMTDNYVIDSVQIVGVYGRPNGASYTDHLHLSFVYGNLATGSNIDKNGFIDPTLLANYGLASTDTAWFAETYYDSTTNAMTNNTGGVAPVTYDFPLTAADTSVTFTHGYTYPVHFAVPAGNMAAMSVSFRPGSSFVPFDTVIYTDGTYKYGDFEPIVNFATDGAAGNVVFAPYTGGNHMTDDQTYGYLKTLGSTDGGWVGNYVPHISYSSSTGGGWYEQFPFILFHVGASTLKVQTVNTNLKNVVASPNPASSEVNINFSLVSASKVTVTLTNAMGEVVSSTEADNMNSGKVTINTSNLASGVYFYTVTANGERSTGRVAIAH